MSESVISSGEDLKKAVGGGTVREPVKEEKTGLWDSLLAQVDSEITKYESEYKGIESSIDSQVDKSLEQTLGDKPPEVQKNILQERERFQITGQRKLEPLLVPINEQISNVEDKIKVYKPSTGVLGKFFKAKELTPQEKIDLAGLESRYNKLLDLRRQIKSTQSRYKISNQGIQEEISRIDKESKGSREDKLKEVKKQKEEVKRKKQKLESSTSPEISDSKKVLEGEKLDVKKQKLDVKYHVEKHKHTSKDLSEVKKEIKKKRDEGASDEEIGKLEREKKEKEEEIKKHKDGYKEKKKELKSSLSEKIERAKEKIKELRKKEKEGDVSKEEKEKDKKEAEELHHHVNHLEGEERDLKETHPKDSLDEHDNESFSERLRRINESDEMSVFIFFCAVSVFVFIITAFFAYDSSTFSSSNNTSIPEYALWAGGAYFLIFVALLAIGFGKDKKTLEKIAGGVLIAGSIFMGTFFTYLKTNGDFKNLTGPESLSTSIAVAVTYIFIFFAIYYDLFEKSRSKLSSDLRIGYNIFSVVLFLVLGGMMTYLTFGSEYSSDPNLKFLLPLSSGLFFLGLIGVIFAIASTSKSFDSILDEPLKLALDIIDRTNFKIIIMACFIASIYMTYILYYSYTSKDVSGSNLKGGDKISFRDNWIENSFYSGVILISFFLLMLGLTFGGNMKEKAFATLMVLFIVFVGSMLLWLDGEDKIDATGDTRTVLTASEIIFVILVVLMIYYILFAASTTGDKIISSLGKLIVQVGSIVFFVFAYAMLLAIIFWYWPGRIWDEPAELWVAFGISTAVLLGSIGLAFFV